ncbi:MAG: hypothetical protein ACJ78V_20715 [Myxococcales bacterium]
MCVLLRRDAALAVDDHGVRTASPAVARPRRTQSPARRADRIERSGVGSGAGEWDHDRVLQLVSNLLAHALDRSSETTAISLAWSGTAHGVFVEVDYEPDAPGADRDIGLGLSVARRIALAHGGDIRKSHTSSAARLRLDLPRLIPVRAVLTAGARDYGRVGCGGS